MKKLLVALLVGAALALTGCTSDNEVVNKNLDKEADNFKVFRRVVFYNAILDKYIMVVDGYCSVDPGNSERMGVTCKVGNGYKRNAMGKSDNVLWFYTQSDPSNVSAKHYKVVLKPTVIIPEGEVR